MADSNDAYGRHRGRGRRLRGAFTLMELLTVVALISLLLMIMAPGILRALAVTRTARCGANLREIGKAVANFRSDKPNGDLSALVWQQTLEPYLDYNSDIFKCSEFVRENTSSTEMALTDLACFYTEYGGNSYYTELKDGPFVIQLNDTQWHAARAQGLLTEAADDFPVDAPEWQYVDDGSGVYWLCLEDWFENVSDLDFKDVMMKVTDTGEGELLLEMCAGTTGHINWVRSKSDPEDFPMVRVPASTPIGTPITYRLPIGARETSYGMNENVHKIRFNGTKILALDYVWIVARTTHDWSSMTGPTPGVPSFARHANRMNVLFTGGEVILMRDEQIDPGFDDSNRYLWEERWEQ